MRALVYTGPNALELRDESVPTAVDGEVVVQVEAVGICGSARLSRLRFTPPGADPGP
ncbi:MAG: hypothetical protein QOJ15_10010 [Bradyrhizobium sp.]|nr:hypothetical protein [Bradyrhizobium sp.]